MFDFLKKLFKEKKQKENIAIPQPITKCEIIKKIAIEKKCQSDGTPRGDAFFIRQQRRRNKRDMQYKTNRIHRRMGFS